MLATPISANQGGVGVRGFGLGIQAIDRSRGSKDQEIRGVGQGVGRVDQEGVLPVWLYM